MTTENQPDLGTQEKQIREYWQILLKHRRLIIIIFLGIVTLGAIYTLTQTPTYQATTKILVERAAPTIFSSQETVAFDYRGNEFYKTQYQILVSDSLAREVIKRLHLDKHRLFRKYSENKGDGGSHPNPGKARVNDAGLVNYFLKSLKIELVRESHIVKVSFFSSDPRLAAEAANSLAQAYNDWNLGLRLKTYQNAAVFLDDQVKEAKRKLQVSEQALQQYREKYGMAALSASQATKEGLGGQDITRQKLAQVNTQLVEATNKRIEAEINYKKARELLPYPERAETIPEAVNNPTIVAMKTQEVQLLREKAEKTQKFGPKHPTMVALTEEIENLKRQKNQEIKNIVETLKSKYEISLSQEKSLQAALGDSQTETINRDKVAIQYQVLSQEVESNRNLYDMLLKRLKEANVSEENRLVNIHVVDPAMVPTVPYEPKLLLNILGACLIGLILGVGVSFFLEHLDNTIKTPEDLEKYLHVPFLGLVPQFEVENLKIPQPELVVFNDFRSPASEAYRGIRTGILFSTPGHSPRSILVSSSGSMEGKTLTSANLAITMAQAGQRVLMLDADMRKPRLHKVLNCSEEPGLSNILVGEVTWQEVRIKTNIPGLEVIPSGPIPPNPSELLGSERMQSLIREISQEYDRLLIDSPPLAAITDSVLISRFVDGVVFVIQAGKTARNIISNSLRQLKDVHANLLGAVLNKVNFSRNSYYYSHFYHYYYRDQGVNNKRKKKRL